MLAALADYFGDIFLSLTNKKACCTTVKQAGRQKKSKKANKRSQTMSTGPAQVTVLPSSSSNSSNSNSNNNNSNNNNSCSPGHNSTSCTVITQSSQSQQPPLSSSSSSSPSALASALIGTSKMATSAISAAAAASVATAIGASIPVSCDTSSTTSASSAAQQSSTTISSPAAAASTGMLIANNNNNNSGNSGNNNNSSCSANNSVASGNNQTSNVTAAVTSQQPKDSGALESASVTTTTASDPLSRHNSLGGKQRSLGGKGKHLTRSHAMRESTSPPRTPTPRSPIDPQQTNQQTNNNNSLSISGGCGEPGSSPSPNNGNSSIHSPVSNESRSFNNSSNDYNSSTNNNNNSSSTGSIVFYGSGSDERGGGKSQLDLDFPKLTPPKSTFQHQQTNNGGGKNGGRNGKGDHQESGKKGCDPASASGHDLKESSGKSPTTMLLDPTGATELPFKSGNGNNKSSNQNNTSSSSPVSSNNNYCDNENRNLREVNCSANSNDSNNQINIQFSHEENRYIQCESPTDSLIRNNSSSNSNINSSAHNNKKHRMGGGNAGGGGGMVGGMPGGGGGGNLTGKGNKPRLKHLSGGSSSSVDGCPGGGGGPSAEFLSRDNSCEQFTDQSGVNLIQFFKETLNKNFKDRNMLMKIEKELLALAMDRSRSQIKFPPMSSYNRMLIHRVAAYFGMEHNVDATQQSVIAEVTPATRIPDIRFKTLINESFSDEPRKSILKRDTHSFDEYRYGLLHCPDRGVLDRKAKSFEEREEEYEKAKRRIFKNREDGGSEEQWQWLSAENAEPMNGRPKLQNNRLLKVQSVSIEGRSDERPCVSKSHSFGGYGGSSQNASLLRGDSITSTKSAGARLFSKQDSNASTNTPWRLSPSSSGYKTQSIRSDSVTPSPTGYGSGDHTPEPCIQSPSSTCGVVWAVTDMASVPKGSVLIDPQTLQPIVNQDGSIYHYDPSNLPATANLPGTNARNQRKKFEKQKSFSNRNPMNSSSSLESSIDIPLNKNDCGQQTGGSTTTTIAEEVGSELCYDMTTGTVKISTKDNHEMDENSSLCEEISQTTNELSTFKLQKHQATSPMLQASELQPLELSEIQLNANHEDRGSLEAITPTGMTDSDSVATLMVAVPSSSDLGLKTDSHHPPQHHVQQMPLDEGGNDGASEHSQDTLDNGGKKDDVTISGGKISVVPTVPMMSYSNSVTPNSGYTVNFDNGSGTPGVSGTTAVYTSGTPGMSTTYQTGPDGTIYAVPSPLVYTYPSTMDQEMSGYFVPVYDQQRGETSLCTATGAPFYHPSAAGATSTTVLPIAYTPATAAAYSGAPIYQNPTTAVMYSSDQFSGGAPGASSAAAAAAAAAAAGSLQQYPIGYPIGIGYPFNNTAYQNYWNQPITYYVPQTPVPSAGSTPLIMPPPVPQTPTNSGMIGAAPNSLSGKRNSTPPGHGSHSQNQSQSASVTPVPISPFATNIPVPMADPSGGGPLYAIPQPIYSNMLPFAAAGPMTPHHHPHHHPAGGGTIMNPVLPTATAAASTGYHTHPHSAQSNQSGNPDSLNSSNGSSHNIYSNSNHTHNNNAPTPQSTPGTPLSLPLSLPPHAKNPPLFATPPILSNGYTPQQMGGGPSSSGNAGHHHYHSNNGGGNNNSYEDRKSSGSSGGYQGKRSNQSGGNYFNYSNNNNSRQMTPNSSGGSGSYQGTSGPKNSGGFANTTNNTGNNHNANNNAGGTLMLGGQPPKTGQPRAESQPNMTKPPLIPTLPNSNNSTNSSNTNPSDKSSSRINRSSKPPNLDLKRNFSNFNVNNNNNSRNTPSTNSTESNNSPNSITSSSVHEHSHHSHHPSQQQQGHHHHPAHGSFYAAQQQQQATAGGPPPYYHHQHHHHRGGSVGSNSGAAAAAVAGGAAAAGAGAAIAAAAAHTMPTSNTIQTAVAAAACAAAIEPYHSQLIPLNAAGMSYVKIGQTYFTHPSLALPPSRRSPPNDIRPIAGVYPTMNMVMPATRQFTPRPQHSNSYKGTKAPR
ncbi:protein encore isoform X2 [Uranotaenia lowii]|uniref:protein encore isoform X2 n=1 Tax=Uranotaenia lowii TaxID=190385 RepID=UPI0024792733|nr:protein encore isoform X2 [Uranotaenia lowii]